MTLNIAADLRSQPVTSSDHGGRIYLEIREFTGSHDRFLIVDGETVYHLGASLKDLGKKWFAFSKMDKAGLKVMAKVSAVLATRA